MNLHLSAASVTDDSTPAATVDNELEETKKMF